MISGKDGNGYTIPNIGPSSPQQHVRPQNTERDMIDQKTQDLILMTNGKGPRRWRQRKSEYLKKLESDNSQLKNLIIEIQQQISALQAQNDILRDQLTYFQGCLSQAAPLVFPNNSEAQGEIKP